MKSRARLVVRITSLIESLPVDVQRTVARDIFQSYGGALTIAERASRYRDRKRASERHEAVTGKAEEPSRNGDEFRDENVTKTSRGIGLSSTGSKNLELEASTTDLYAVTRTSRKSDAIGFDQFWESYPRKVAKQTALSAWRRRQPDITLILPALERQKASPDWLKDNGQYIPHPATWLNGERWKDELRTNGHKRDVNDPWKGKTHVGDVKL